MGADFQRLADILLREAAAEFEDYPGLEADLALAGVQLQRRLGERASEDGRIGERYEPPCQREYSYRRHHDHPPRHVCSLLPAPSVHGYILHELQRVVHRISRQCDRDRVQTFFYDVTQRPPSSQYEASTNSPGNYPLTR